MSTTAISLNLDTRAATQYTNYGFKSFATFQGQPIGAGPNGIFKLDSGNLDNTTPIAAWFELPMLTFGSDKIKKIFKAIIQGEYNGDLTFTMTADKVATFTQTIVASISRVINRGQPFYLPTSVLGTWWSFKIANVAGCDFAIDSLDVCILETPLEQLSRDIHAAGGIKIILSDIVVSGTD
jgi:hypothetical protein